MTTPPECSIGIDPDAVPLALLRGAGIDPDMVTGLSFIWKPGDVPVLAVTSVIGIDPDAVELIFATQEWKPA